MTDKLPFLYATDKDIFDLLMSSRARMSEAVLHGIAISRGVIYSKKTDRERLASDISALPHDFLSLRKLIERREQQSRHEKRAYVDLPISLTHEDINQAIKAYKVEVGNEEIVTTQQRRAQDVYVNVAYDEIDYSKTRLIQRQRRDAGVEFVIGADKTTIRMPATEKARAIVDRLIHQVSKIKLQDLRRRDLSLAGLSADQRNSFFMQMMLSLAGFQLQTVVSIKCASDDEEVADDFELDIENERSVDSEIISKINSVALSGMNLLQSEEYQALRRNGFFITAVTWRAIQKEKPQDLFQFDVSFDDPKEGKGFRFGVRIARRLTDGALTSDFKPLDSIRQPSLWSLVERASSDVLKSILTLPAKGEAISKKGEAA